MGRPTEGLAAAAMTVALLDQVGGSLRPCMPPMVTATARWLAQSGQVSNLRAFAAPPATESHPFVGDLPWTCQSSSGSGLEAAPDPPVEAELMFVISQVTDLGLRWFTTRCPMP